MTATSTGQGSNYLASTRAVLQSGWSLWEALEADEPEERDFAVRQLERAAQQQQDGALGFRSYRFSAIETTQPNERAHEQATEETLASIVTDLHVANVLMVAGVALDETGPPPKTDASPPPKPRLDDALAQLDNTTREMQAGLDPLAGGGAHRFGFVAATPAASVSADVPQAKEHFRNRTEATLTTLVEETKGVVAAFLEALDKRSDQVLGALAKLGDRLGDLPSVGRLLRQGIQKFQAAINALIQLVGSQVLAKVKERVQQFWTEVRQGKHLEALLEMLLGIKDARAHAERSLGADGLTVQSLDSASNALAQLTTDYSGKMRFARNLLAGVTACGTVLAWIPVIPAQVALAIVVVDALILAVVLLMGMDYADASPILNRVRGVRAIADSVGAAASSAAIMPDGIASPPQ